MKKIFLCLCTLSLSFLSLPQFFSCKPPSTHTPVNQDTTDTTPLFTKIDAFTSASKYLTIDSILVYSDSAIVYWRDWYNNGDVHLIKWGTSPDIYTDSISLLPFEERTRIKTTLKPLTPETHYYAEFFRVYNRGNPVRTKFEFTTLKRKT